jgi:hypothetical protein
MLQPVRIFPITPVRWPPRGLHVGGTPGLGPDGAQEGGRVKGACADLHIIRLQQGAALPAPVVLERKNQVLKCLCWFWHGLLFYVVCKPPSITCGNANFPKPAPLHPD